MLSQDLLDSGNLSKSFSNYIHIIKQRVFAQRNQQHKNNNNNNNKNQIKSHSEKFTTCSKITSLDSKDFNIRQQHQKQEVTLLTQTQNNNTKNNNNVNKINNVKNNYHHNCNSNKSSKNNNNNTMTTTTTTTIKTTTTTTTTNIIAKKDKFHLVKYDETPEHLKREYILHGYRVDFSYWLALKSMFIPGHNDFSNIHTHLIAVFYFLYLMYETFIVNKHGMDTADYVVFAVFLLAGLSTYVCSTLYHTFGCHSYESYQRFLLCDYMGIIMLIGSSFIPGLYYSYKSHHHIMLTYMTTIVSLCVLLSIFIFVPKYNDFDTTRNIIFSATAAFGIIPTLHTYFIHGDKAWDFITRMICMFLMFAIGLFFFITKLPERLKPGFFDNIITSHSIWHIFTFITPLFHFETCLEMFRVFRDSDLSESLLIPLINQNI
ncbi:hypothetical protein CYY_005051 [Polysphondylium violaceum]|uniref:Uncharacterized protein n=1 Tax=Polysphondylium violaceum TaxID=133409 RepID=A0A8J4PVH6_9MYCE|nr:hypothetical protein CYY_005051 [Polysphondylium violaceum]